MIWQQWKQTREREGGCPFGITDKQRISIMTVTTFLRPVFCDV